VARIIEVLGEAQCYDSDDVRALTRALIEEASIIKDSRCWMSQVVPASRH